MGRLTSHLDPRSATFKRGEDRMRALCDELQVRLAEARKGGRVRLWSAGCSSGEEPYSMALAGLALMPDAAPTT